MTVEVADKDLCPRYCARVVKNIKIAPSPKWMQRRLASNGIRPINNIVDITNYVMEEYGQPMHAYDYDTLAGHKIVVRRAENGEKFTTLDGQERTMDDSVLMICDGEKAVGIAGIMGGENSMITDNVKTMMFELHVLMAPTSAFLQRKSVLEPMLLASSKKVWIRTMHRQRSIVHAS